MFAKKNFESAKLKSEQIRNQGSLLSLEMTKSLLDIIEEDIKRLKISNLSILKLEKEKSINEICQKLNQFAITKGIEKINKKINSSVQKKIISQSIQKLSTKILTQN